MVWVYIGLPRLFVRVFILPWGDWHHAPFAFLFWSTHISGVLNNSSLHFLEQNLSGLVINTASLPIKFCLFAYLDFFYSVLHPAPFTFEDLCSYLSILLFCSSIYLFLSLSQARLYYLGQCPDSCFINIHLHFFLFYPFR